MFKTLKNAWKIQDIQNKILFTLLIILLYRLGSAIMVPYVSHDVAKYFTGEFGGTILGYFSILSGGAMSQATFFALSVSPYITSSIVIQLLTVAFPNSLGKIAKDGEEGQKKIKKYTRWITVAIALVTAYGYTALLGNNHWLDANYIEWGGMWSTNGFDGTLATLVIIASYVSGAAIIMWLAELIDAKGIGNGISMILFFNIISGAPQLVMGLWNMITENPEESGGLVVGIILGVVSIIITVLMVLLIVWVTHSERRIPIQYAKRVVGRKMYGGQGTNLPIKLNMTGVMPVIFASSIVSVPATIAMFFQGSGFEKWVTKYLGPTSALYIVIYILLIVAFAYFYVLISFNPLEVANNIKNNGGSVPGIRTGRPTAEYITKILNRITLIGAIFLVVVAGLPMVIGAVNAGLAEKAAEAGKTAVQLQGLAFGGTSLLIVIGVAIETFRDIEAQITMRNYKGFLD